MKRYKYYILSLAVLCSFSACDSLLNEDPLFFRPKIMQN